MSSTGSSGGASAAGSPTSSGRPPIVVATTGTPAAIASTAASGMTSAQRDGTIASAARARSAATSSAETGRRSGPVAGARADRVRVGAVAGDDERQARARARLDRDVDALLARSRAATSACSPPPRPSARRTSAAPAARRGPARRRSARRSARRRSTANALGTTSASTCPTRRRCHSRERGRVDDRLGGAAAAGEPHARAGVAALAADAVVPVRVEARPDRADEAVVVEVEHDAGAGARAAASARQPSDGLTLCAWTTRAPVRRTAAATSSGCRPPASIPAAAFAAAERGGVALEDLGVLAEVLAHEPREVLDDAFLPAGHAVAVVQEEDHASGEASLCARMDLAVQIVNFNTKAHLVPCLESVVAALSRSGLSGRVLVLENGSDDDLRDLAPTFGDTVEWHDSRRQPGLRRRTEPAGAGDPLAVSVLRQPGRRHAGRCRRARHAGPGVRGS